MNTKWKERLGLVRLTPGESIGMDRINIKVILMGAFAVMAFSVFLFVNILVMPGMDNVTDITDVPEQTEEFANEKGIGGRADDVLPGGIGEDSLAGEDAPDAGKPDLKTYVDNPNAQMINPSMGSGSFLGLISSCLGINNRTDSTLIIRGLATALFIYGVVVILLCGGYLVANKYGRYFAFAATYSVPLFYAAACVLLYSINGAGNLLVYLIISLAVPAIVSVNPTFEFIVYLAEGVFFCVISSMHASLSGMVILNILIFCAITMFLCINVYYDRLKSCQNEIIIKDMSTHDALTGLKNRHALLEDEASYNGKEMVIAMMDVDDFKYFNDSFGHEFGDDVLARFAAVLKEHFDKEGVYRYGGDEFVIVSPLSEDEFRKNMEECRQHIHEISSGNHQELYLTCSCGFVAGLIESAEDFRLMSVSADQKLYEAKRLGKDCVVGAPYVKEDISGIVTGDWDLVYKTNDLDILTKLPNKLHFMNRAAKVLSAAGDISQLAIVFINIENFHVYNLQYGYDAGDRFLKELAADIKNIFKKDLASRFEGDRFAVLTNRAHVVGKMEELHEFGRNAFGAPQEIKMGVAMFAPGDDSVPVICDRAMLACESIKNKYDKYYRFYDKSLERNMYVQQYFYENLDDAIEKRKLVVFYQPIVRAITGRMCSAEALVRWKDDELGYIAPDEFIEILEDSHLIHRVDTYVIERVCRDIADMIERGIAPVPISVNLSRMDFWLCDVLEIIESNVSRYDIPKNLISFELTESALIEEPGELRNQVQNLINSGYRVWVDDFGSGYSSLNILKDYNFEVIKFAPEFLEEFEMNKRSRKMIEIMIQMAKDLDIQSLVEGVETREQYEFLLGTGCEKIQGFYFAKPMEYEELLDAMGDIVLVEDVNLKEYYDNISSITIQGRVPGANMGSNKGKPLLELYISVWEMVGDTLKVRMTNDIFKRRMKNIGIDTLEDLEARFNMPDNESGAWMRERLKTAFENDSTRVEQVEIHGKKYAMIFRKEAQRDGRYAVCCTAYEEYE